MSPCHSRLSVQVVTFPGDFAMIGSQEDSRTSVLTV